MPEGRRFAKNLEFLSPTRYPICGVGIWPPKRISRCGQGWFSLGCLALLSDPSGRVPARPRCSRRSGSEGRTRPADGRPRPQSASQRRLPGQQSASAGGAAPSQRPAIQDPAERLWPPSRRRRPGGSLLHRQPDLQKWSSTAPRPACRPPSRSARCAFPGWIEALQPDAREGDHWQIWLPANSSPMARASFPDGGIPPNRTLIFDLAAAAGQGAAQGRRSWIVRKIQMARRPSSAAARQQ